MLPKEYFKEIQKSLEKDTKNWVETLKKYQDSQVDKLINDFHQKLYNHYYD